MEEVTRNQRKKDKRERKNTAKGFGVPSSDTTSEIGDKSEVDPTATSSSKKKKREKKQDKAEKEAVEGKGGAADEEDAGGAAETGADDKA